MADGEGGADSAVGADGRPRRMPLELAQRLRKNLRGLEARLREQGPGAAASTAYCKRFCQILLQYAGDQNSSKHAVHLLEVYRISIQSFARARQFLTTECEDVLLVLGKLVLSCFELLLSVPESELFCEEWVLFQQSIQASNDALSEFGNHNLQTLVDAIKEGGVWKSPIIIKILGQQKVQPEEVTKLIEQEGTSFIELRIKHLMKSNCIPQAMFLSKLCTESSETSNAKSFRQSYITCLCTMLPNEEAIKEISKVDGREVLDIICNLETEGHDNTAFILCTTYLTQQLQTENIDCSWELTLFWSKLQRRIDPSLDTFLERCRQFGVIAKTLQHLFFLIRVVHSEAEEEGLSVSILLCVRALQIKSDENDMKTSVCKTVACLLPHDLEVRRGCQLTEFLLEPNEDGYKVLEALHLQPDQKFDEENAIVPNSLRCELLLALKAHWPFDPEFWDWKTLNRHCLKLLGKDASDSEDNEISNEMADNNTNIVETSLSDNEEAKEQHHLKEESVANEAKEKKVKKPVGIKKPVGSSERYQRWLQYKFFCLICKREVIEARILHHAKMHLVDGIYTCPVCVKKFKKKEVFVPHVMEHVKMPSRHKPRKKIIKKERITKSARKSAPMISSSFIENQQLDVESIDPFQYVTFRQLEDYNLQDRDLYPCPGTECSRIFKQFKYLSVHLKAEHQNNDENAKHYLDMKNKREKCGFCRRHFITNFHLRDHERVHIDAQPFMCVSIDCFAKFSSVNELLSHKQMHSDLQYKCELKGCNIVFSDLGQLFHHEAQHFRDAAHACTFHGCKKFYYSKIDFQNHLATHDITKTKAVNQVTNPLEELVTIKSESSPLAYQLLNQSDAIQTSDVHESLVLSMESSNSQIIPEIKKETDSDKNINGESSHCALTESPIPLLENQTTCTSEEKQESHSLSETVDSNEIVLNIRASNNKFFVSSHLKEQFSIFSVTFDGKQFTCGFEGCGVSRKNTRGMHKHLRNDHPNHFKPKKRAGINARNLLQLFSGSQKSKRTRKLGARQEHSDKKDTFKRRRLVCNSRRKRVLKGDLCQPTTQLKAFSALPKILSTEDAILELLLGLKHLSLKNSSPHTHSSISLQKPVLKSFQAVPSVCTTSTNLAVENTILQRSSSEQEIFTNQCLARLAAKPFSCELQGCKHAFVTRDALLVHYVKKHNYSKENVLQFSMFQHKFAPFQCHICQRAFTRRTHLRIHYRQKHQLGKVKLPRRLLSAKKRGENKNLQTPIENILNRSRTSSTSAFKSSTVEELDDEVNIFEQQMKHEMCRFKKGEYCSETDDSLSEEMDVHLGEKPSTFLLQDRHRDDLELREGRGSKRTVAKGDLCYILNKYHKPFHCIHKSCNSSFTSQQGLIRHYRIVHHYNREQLCLEKDKAKSKRDFVKYKKIFACKYQDCSKRFLCSKALAKHCSDIHNLYNGDDQRFLSITESARFSCDQPQCLAMFYTFNKLKHHQMEDHSTEDMQNKDIEIRCELNGCDRLFTHHSTYSQHVYYSHRECYDDIFGRPEEVEDNVVEEGTCKVENKQDLREKCQFHTNGKTMKKVDRRFGKRTVKKIQTNIQFRTKEEAIDMCLEEIEHTQYPCMVHGCLSVVKLESSIVRHYKRSHLFTSVYIEQHYQKLVLCVKHGTRDKDDSCLETKLYLSKGDVNNYMQGSKKRKKCLLKGGRQFIQNDYHYQDKENENYSRNAVGNDTLFNADSFLCKGMLKYNKRSNTACFEDCITETSLCKIEQSQPESSENENASYFSSFHLPLKRKTECDDWELSSVHTDDARNTLHAAKENCQKQALARTFDLKSFKPMGFESSFLKFIQEREEKDDDFEDQTEWEPEKFCTPSILTHKLDVEINVDENTQEVSIPQIVSESELHGQVTESHPSTSPTELPTVPSLQNLRAILDKALTDCGDLALKQLHYLRPVVVLERSKFSTPLVDLFPAKKTDGLCVGSS